MKYNYISGMDLRDELREMGVNMLSGEGCNLGLRIDTDVSPQAEPLVSAFLGGVQLTHSGFNGWSQDPEGKYHAGGSARWNYDEKAYKAGWRGTSGKCFKMPRILINDLAVYLFLANGKAEAVVRIRTEAMVSFNLFSNRQDYLEWIEKYDQYYKNEEWQVFFAGQVPANTHQFSGKTIE